MWKVLLYNPVEYLTNHYMLFVPMILTLIFLFLRKNLKNIRDTNKGLEIYLYKYRSSKIQSLAEWQKVKLKLDKDKKEWIEHFYDRDKIQEVFGPLGADAVLAERDPDWWRFHTHLDKNHDIGFYKHIKFFMFIFLTYFVVEYWKAYKFQYRNSKWLWDYYMYDQKLYDFLKKTNQYAPKHFGEREWLQDSWIRLENGGNLYTRWYENYYRNLRNLPLKPLDYGFDWQKIKDNIDMETLWKKKLVHMDFSSFADAYWIYLGRKLEIHMDLELSQYKSLSDKNMLLLLMKKVKTKKLKIHKKFVREKHISKEEFFLRNEFVDKEIKLNRENNTLFINDAINRWGMIKNTIKSELYDIRLELKKLYLGQRYINKKNPFKGWFEFIQWIEDKYGYNLLEREHVYSTFLIESKLKTKLFLEKDIKRYMKKENDYISKWYNTQISMRENELYLNHKICFEYGTPLDIRTLLSVTEKEKHFHNFCFHFMKYKLDRIIIIRRTNNKMYLNYILKKEKLFKKYNLNQDWILDKNSVNNYKNIIKEWGDGRILYEHQWDALEIARDKIFKHEKIVKSLKIADTKYITNIVNDLKKYIKYIKNLNKEIPKSEIIEYKSNLLINFWKEKKNLLIFIKDFNEQLDILELLAILIKLIMKIWV